MDLSEKKENLPEKQTISHKEMAICDAYLTNYNYTKTAEILGVSQKLVSTTVNSDHAQPYIEKMLNMTSHEYQAIRNQQILQLKELSRITMKDLQTASLSERLRAIEIMGKYLGIGMQTPMVNNTTINVGSHLGTADDVIKIG